MFALGSIKALRDNLPPKISKTLMKFEFFLKFLKFKSINDSDSNGHSKIDFLKKNLLAKIDKKKADASTKIFQPIDQIQNII